MSHARSFGLVFLALSGIPLPAAGAENCDTILSRIARRAAEKAVADHRDDACSGAKLGPLAIDRTKELDLRSVRVCEDGLRVTAAAVVHIKCGTSDAAFIRKDIADDITVAAAADFDTCQISDATITAGSAVVRFLLSAARASQHLREKLEKEIKPYCR